MLKHAYQIYFNYMVIKVPTENDMVYLILTCYPFDLLSYKLGESYFPGDFITLRYSDKSYLIQGLSESYMCEHL